MMRRLGNRIAVRRQLRLLRRWKTWFNLSDEIADNGRWGLRVGHECNLPDRPVCNRLEASCSTPTSASVLMVHSAPSNPPNELPQDQRRRLCSAITSRSQHARGFPHRPSGLSRMQEGCCVQPGSGQTPRLDADAASKALPGRRRLAIGPMRSTRGPTVLLRGERFEASTLATSLATAEGSAPESSSLSMTSIALVRAAA